MTSSDSPARGWRIAFLVLCTVGLCLSADLVRMHVKVHTDPEYQSYCAISAKVNCETVAASDYAVLLGLPVAVWGLLAYLAMALLAIWGLRRRLPVPGWPFGALTLLSTVAALVGVVLFLISHLVIESVCIVCAGTYLVNLGLLLSAWCELRRLKLAPLAAAAAEFGAVRAQPGPAGTLIGGVLIVTLVTHIAVPPYWRLEASTGPGGVAIGYTADGHHWIGGAEAALEIVEFSDYQCPHCQRGHDQIRRLLVKHPGKLRLVHRHYPLDHRCNPTVRRPFHQQACEYAELAHCAGMQSEQGFWLANDYLYAQGRRASPVTADELAQVAGLQVEVLLECLRSDAPRAAVRDDIEAGQKRQVRGTPTFVVGDEVYPGRIPEEVLRAAIGADAVLD